jgi:hypothetical protein
MSAHRLPRQGTKCRRLLRRLVNGERLHCLLDLKTTCLHTDMSVLERRYGIQVNRRPIVLTGYGGVRTHVKEYFLDHAERQRVRTLFEADREC